MTLAEGLGPLLPQLRVPPPGPASRLLAERLGAVESRNVTFMAEDWPVFWHEAAGANVRDADQNLYVDFTSGFGVALVGHSNPSVVDAITAQAGKLLHGMGDVHPPTPRVELLERLAAMAPWAGARAVLASTGSEAVEIALKTASLASGRPGVLAFEGGYHGLTAGALAVTHRDHFREPFEARIYPGVAFAPFPAEGSRPGSTAEESLRRVEELLRLGAPNGDPIGAVVVEPIQGRAGVRVPPPGFLVTVSELAAAAGAVVVADEVFSGMGRCGSAFASDLVGLLPDLICVGKALGGGMPVSACLGAPTVMEAWPASRGEAIHTSTFLGHPLACAAALAAMEQFETLGGVERVREGGIRLMGLLNERLSASAGVGEVRGSGLLVGIEMVRDDGVTPAEGAAVDVATAALGRGLIVLPAGAQGHVVQLTPPMVVTNEQMEFAVEVLADVIGEAT